VSDHDIQQFVLEHSNATTIAGVSGAATVATVPFFEEALMFGVTGVEILWCLGAVVVILAIAVKILEVVYLRKQIKSLEENQNPTNPKESKSDVSTKPRAIPERAGRGNADTCD